MKNPENMKNSLLAASVFLLSTTVLQASLITWSVSDFTSESDVSTRGTVLEAFNFGNGSPTTTLNGTTFTSANHVSGLPASAHLSGNLDRQAANSSFYTGPNTTIEPLFDTFAWTEVTTDTSFTLDDLVIGQIYEMQLLISDDRNNSNAVNHRAQVDGGVSGIFGGPLNPPQSFIGTFQADATMQMFSYAVFDGSGDPTSIRLSAYRLAAIPEPSSILILLGFLGSSVFLRRRRRLCA